MSLTSSTMDIKPSALILNDKEHKLYTHSLTEVNDTEPRIWMHTSR